MYTNFGRILLIVQIIRFQPDPAARELGVPGTFRQQARAVLTPIRCKAISRAFSSAKTRNVFSPVRFASSR